MAVVASTPAGIGEMMCVGGQVVLNVLMALQTSVIGVHFGAKLVVGITAVHGMAGQARHLPILKARRIIHRRKLATTDAHCAVFPISELQIGALLNVWVIEAMDQPSGMQVVPGAIFEPALKIL